MVRTLDGHARAFLSDRYRRLDNYDLCEHVLPILQRLPEASPALRALIEKQAEGKPVYAEELVKMLIDDGVSVECYTTSFDDADISTQDSERFKVKGP